MCFDMGNFDGPTIIFSDDDSLVDEITIKISKA